MPFEVVLPRLGWNMETGRLGEWLKRDGERVEAGEILFTVEGDKATQEIEALDSGILRIPPDSPPPGKEVPVGTLLGYLLAPGEEPEAGSWKLEAGNAEVRAATPASQTMQQPAVSLQLPVSSNQQPASSNQPPAISPRAAASPVSWAWTGPASPAAAAPGGSSSATCGRQPRPSAVSRSAVSPLARRLAAELGVDVDALAARLPGKRIERADIEAEAEG